MSTLADSFGCSPPISCPGSDLPLLNLSSEGPDFPVFVGLNFGPLIPPPVLNHFSDLGCLSECDSTVSQQEADLCAARQSVFCVNGSNPNFPVPPPVCNTPQTATVTCPDGLPFSYTVPAGIFCGNSQTLVNEQAFAYAIQLANAQRVCLGSLQRCTCINLAYSSIIPISGAMGTVVWSIVTGALPPGLTLNQNGSITGIPVANGTYSFTVQALTLVGTFMRKPFSIVVLQITTTSIPNFTVATPYSFQMQVVGGSGSYAWKITSGSLPAGLVLDASGLIHGTPTGATFAANPIVFSVIDLTCELLDQSFFPPRVSLSTKSTTTISTIYGYPEYGTPSSPPKKYHSITWSGTAEQVAYLIGGTANDVLYVAQIANAKYVYSGTGTVDVNGHQISNYSKALFTACPASNFSPNFSTNLFSSPTSLKGYCYPPDPLSCPTCSYPPFTNVPTGQGNFPPFGTFIPLFKGETQANNTKDLPYDLLGGSSFVTLSTTQISKTDSTAFPEVIMQNSGPGAANLPTTVFGINGLNGPWVGVFAVYNITATLTNEFTDAEALSNAVIINSNGATAQTLNRTTGFVSTDTTVSFAVTCSNLVVGQTYLATVTLFDTTNGSKTLNQYTFTANQVTHTINDSIPTPAQGHSVTVLNPTVSLVP